MPPLAGETGAGCRGGSSLVIGAYAKGLPPFEIESARSAGSGLAYRIAESGYRLDIPRMFAALVLLAMTGIVIYFAMSLVSHLVLRRWHESAVAREP